MQVTTREGPLEWFGGPLVASLKDHHVPLQIAAGWPIRFPAHDLADEAVECRDTVLAFAAAEQSGSMHVPRGKVSQRTGTSILVLDVDRAP